MIVKRVYEFDVELREGFDEPLPLGLGDESKRSEVVVMAVGQQPRDDRHVEPVDFVGWVVGKVLRQNCRAAFYILL